MLNYLFEHLYLVPMFTVFVIVPAIFLLSGDSKKVNCKHILILKWSDGEFWTECENCDYQSTVPDERYDEAYEHLRINKGEWRE
jgi:hypothetical protein